MNTKRKIEIFSAGCPLCLQAVELVKDIACESCEVNILEMHNADVTKRADDLGIKSVPAVVIDGKVAQCCAGAAWTRQRFVLQVLDSRLISYVCDIES